MRSRAWIPVRANRVVMTAAVWPPSHEGDAAVSGCRLGLEADEMNQQLPRPLAKPLNLAVEGDVFRAAGRRQERMPDGPR